MLDPLTTFATVLLQLVSNPDNLLVLLAGSLLGIFFGALPGLTATLGIALLTTLTYGMPMSTALIAMLGLYVGAIYGGSYPAILMNIPGTPASAATAMDGYPLARRGEGGRALGLTTTASLIGTVIGMLVLVLCAPLIARFALQFTSFEFCLLAFFGIVISGTLTSRDLAIKGWIAGLIGLALSTIGRDRLQFYPRYTFELPELDTGLDVVATLIGAFAIPQIIRVLRDRKSLSEPQKIQRVVPGFGTILRHFRHIVRSALIGVGIGAVPGVGEDIAGWVSYGAAKRRRKAVAKSGSDETTGLVSSETANNACIGGALIPLLTLGIPGSPPAVMLLGALMLHGVTPGPMLSIQRPTFFLEVTAILLLASVAMWCNGIVLSRQVVKVLRLPPTIILPVIALLCVLGSYALGFRIFNLYLMLVVGIGAYFLIELDYPISPLVIGVVLGPMADENLRRALMVSEGSLLPFVQRPVSAILLAVILLTIASQLPFFRRLGRKLFPVPQAPDAAVRPADKTRAQ